MPMPMSAEQKQLMRERLKAFWARKRAEKAPQSPDIPAPEPEPQGELLAAEVRPSEPRPVQSRPAEPKPVEPRPSKQQTKAVEARWAGEQATELDLRSHFEALPLPKAFALYERMRHNLETAGRVLNDRSNVPEVQSCKTCGLTMDQYRERSRKNDWFLNRPHYRNGDRNIIDVEHFCSAACVSLENNRTQGVYGMPDQGMLPSDNPKNHPRLSLRTGMNGKA